MPPILNAWITADDGQKIMLMRHGDVRTADDQKRFIGRTDLPLSPVGRRQAQAWQKRLAPLPLAGVACSDLSRCVETARILAADRDLAVQSLPALREIDLGEWENLSFARVKARWPDAFQQRGQDLARFRPPNGESFADLQRRVVPAFERIVDQTAGPILIVAHAGVNRTILCHILGLPLENLFRLAQGSAALTLIDRRAGGYRIRLLNLPPEP